ncbi:MAG: GntR family transcriptional regulator [Brachybacterium sp.]|nr:GntR family transcriptional regulator [Brachybacterium sp.]
MPSPTPPEVKDGVPTSSTLSIVSRLPTPNHAGTRAARVEHQLRTGIGIGMLETGERLPSEDVMARQMSVSPLTFRQSLERLRHDGLVRTRPGRGGGTFIHATDVDLDRLARSALQARTLSEIADLGGAVGELLAGAARYAARRHDAFDDADLRTALRRLADSQDTVGRRRAATLYLVTIARIARNERLLATLVPPVGEMQSIAWVNGSSEVPAALWRSTEQTVSAIIASREDDAARAARDSVRILAGLLLNDRAALYGSRRENGPEDITAAFADLGAQLDDVASHLGEAAERIAEIPAPQRARDASAQRVDEILQTIIHRSGDLVRGAGIAYRPGLLTDSRLWMDWWDRGHSAEPAFKAHEFASRSLQYYDYEAMPWFAQALARETMSVFGPYFDRGGIETMTITVSLGVRAAPFEGCVIGADLDLPAIESLLLRGHVPDGAHHVVLNQDSRVVLSTSPGLQVGDPLPPAKDRPAMTVLAEGTGSISGWTLAQLHPSD